MLQDEVNTKDLRFTFMEMISSVRELNRRIDELKYVVKSGWCNEDCKQKVVDRITQLNETKFRIIHSIYDIRLKVLATYSFSSEERAKMEELFNFSTLYKDLKHI